MNNEWSTKKINEKDYDWTECITIICFSLLHSIVFKQNPIIDPKRNVYVTEVLVVPNSGRHSCELFDRFDWRSVYPSQHRLSDVSSGVVVTIQEWILPVWQWRHTWNRVVLLIFSYSNSLQSRSLPVWQWRHTASRVVLLIFSYSNSLLALDVRKRVPPKLALLDARGPGGNVKDTKEWTKNANV
jgi:hypothetical protein